MSKSTFAPKAPLDFGPEVKMSIGLIADEETTLAFLMAGLGEESRLGKFDTDCFIVSEGISISELEKYFTALHNRDDIKFILIGSNFYSRLSYLVNDSTPGLPIILELPLKQINSHTKFNP